MSAEHYKGYAEISGRERGRERERRGDRRRPSSSGLWLSAEGVGIGAENNADTAAKQRKKTITEKAVVICC